MQESRAEYIADSAGIAAFADAVIGRSCKIINIRRLQIPLQRAMIVDRSADIFVIRSDQRISLCRLPHGLRQGKHRFRLSLAGETVMIRHLLGIHKKIGSPDLLYGRALRRLKGDGRIVPRFAQQFHPVAVTAAQPVAETRHSRRRIVGDMLILPAVVPVEKLPVRESAQMIPDDRLSRICRLQILHKLPQSVSAVPPEFFRHKTRSETFSFPRRFAAETDRVEIDHGFLSVLVGGDMIRVLMSPLHIRFASQIQDDIRFRVHAKNAPEPLLQFGKIISIPAGPETAPVKIPSRGNRQQESMDSGTAEISILR